MKEFVMGLVQIEAFEMDVEDWAEQNSKTRQGSSHSQSQEF